MPPTFAVAVPVLIAVSVLAVAVNVSFRYRKLLQRSRHDESRLRALNNTAVDAIITFDEHGVVQSANPATEHILGWKESELIGQSILQLVSETFQQTHKGELRKYTLGQPSKLTEAHEIDMQHKDGHTVPMRLALGRIESEYAQDAKRFVCFLVDMSHYKALEQERMRDREQLRSLMSNLPGAAFRSRNEDPWPMEYISEGVKDLTGWEADDFLQERINFGQMVNPEDAQRFASEMDAAFREHRSYTIEYRIQARDRSTHWVSESGRGVYDAQGQVCWIDGVLLDITAAKARDAEFIGTVQALNRSEAIAEFDLQGRLLNANKNFLALTGYTLEEVQLQSHFIFCTHEDAQSEAYQQFWANLLQGQYQSGEFLRIGKDGRHVWIQATYNPILDPEGKVFKIIKFATDLSQRKAMEQDLRTAKEHAEHAATARSNFLANMSHEIRTPMNAILGFTDALLDSPLNPSQRRQLSTVQSAGRNLLRLLNDILDTAKLDKGAMSLEVMDFNLRSLCQVTLDTLRIHAVGKGVELKLDYPSDVPDFLQGDALRLQQVLTNIIGNAVKFTPEGHVSLAVRYHDGMLVLTIQDTGIGMTEEQISRIFSPFSQADASTSRRFGGTGLGTTIALQLVQLMHGRIDVESTLGHGSTFTLQLPLAKGHATAPTAPASMLTLPQLRILAADDVPANLEVLQLALMRGGHLLTLAGGGEEAFLKWREGHFDLILMDLQMPDIDGFETSRRIRAQEHAEAKPRTPIIALSASVLDDDRSLAEVAGMDGFAHKPLDLPRLQAEIARVLGIKLTELTPVLRERADVTFDWERGLQLWGSMAALRAALGQFLRDNIDLPSTLHGLLQSGEAVTAQNAAHRLRGAAGNLGLTNLCNALADLELNAHADAALTSLQAVEAAWNAVLQAAPAAMTQPTTTSQAAPLPQFSDAERAQALTIIREIHTVLARGELADAAYASLETLLSADLLQPTQRALDQFELEAAQQQLALLAQQLEDMI